MGYDDKEEVMDDSPSRSATVMHAGLSALVRLIGLAVLIVGLWVGVKIILEAWALYEDPSRIVRFADDIQAHSNLDGVIGSLAAEAESTGAGAGASEQGARQHAGGLRLSYFAAWFIVLLLMFVIGSLAMAAITTGGHLVLYDLQVRTHSRAVVREVRKLRGAT